jgi:hypothetical protein
MIGKKRCMEIETTYSGLTQPIIGTVDAVMLVTGTKVGRNMKVKGRISDQCSSV